MLFFVGDGELLACGQADKTVMIFNSNLIDVHNVFSGKFMNYIVKDMSWIDGWDQSKMAWIPLTPPWYQERGNIDDSRCKIYFSDCLICPRIKVTTRWSHFWIFLWGKKKSMMIYTEVFIMMYNMYYNN